MKLKYATKEEIPVGKEDLFTEQNGEFVLTAVEGMKTQVDIDRIMGGLTKERDEHKVTKTKLTTWDGLERVDIDAKLAKLAELEVAVQGSVPKEEMDKKLDELTEVRTKNRVMPIEREREALKVKLADAEKKLGEYAVRETQRTIHDKVRAASVTAKIQPEVMTDVLLLADNVFQLTEGGELLTKENVYGVDAGLTAETFFQTQQEKRPYWWPPAVGGGGKGTGGGKNNLAGNKNPWTLDHWNLTEQGRYVKEQGMEKAQSMAALAGTTVGGGKPAKK